MPSSDLAPAPVSGRSFLVRSASTTLVAMALMFVAACGDDVPDFVPTADGGADSGADAGTADAGGTDAGGDAATDATQTDVPQADASVDAPPSGSTSPDLRAYSDGECPLIAGGTNGLTSSGIDREFEVFLPPDSEGAPLIFFWYGAGGSTQTYEWMQPFANAYESVIVVPTANGGGGMMNFEWPILATNNSANELVFFDDMLACITESLPVNDRRIYTSGFSAGALWSTLLVFERSHVLASALLFSGGTGGQFLNLYASPEVQIPILGFFGGSADTFGGGLVNFMETMTDLMDNLIVDGHLVVACDHGGGHTVPAGGFDWGIQWLLAHQFGDETSPFENELPGYLPSYCSFWQ